jgi:hypothetical protein
MIWLYSREACGTVILAFLHCLFCFTPIATAQEFGRDLGEEEDRVNYAFAAYLGSGIYAASDGAVQVYSLPLSYTLRPPSEGRPGIKLNFPVTLGFYDFKALDLIEGTLPNDVATISVIPGAEFLFPVRENWSLTQFVDFGAGKDFSGGSLTWIWSTGVNSLAVFSRDDLETTLGNKLQYAAYNAPGEDNRGNFMVFETGLDLMRPLRISSSGRTNRFSLYLMNQIYFNGLELLSYRDNLVKVQYQYEVGFTYVPHKPFKLWLLNVPRIGLGYRFGDGLTAFRLVLSMPF